MKSLLHGNSIEKGGTGSSIWECRSRVMVAYRSAGTKGQSSACTAPHLNLISYMANEVDGKNQVADTGGQNEVSLDGGGCEAARQMQRRYRRGVID